MSVRTPGEREQALLKRALERFESWLSRPLSELELASFGHGWRAGDQGRLLVDVVDEIDARHVQAAQVLEFVAYGHHSGYSSFLRLEPDYDEVYDLLRTGGLEALLEDEPDEPDKPDERVRALERMARLLER